MQKSNSIRQGLTKSQIIQLVREYSFRPHKRLGQNFLIDRNVAEKIISVISPSEKNFFIEIGSGLGALTIPLARSSARITAIEIDKKLSSILKEKTTEFKNVTVVHQDFLKTNFANFPVGIKIRIIGNLPYYITTPIIEKLVENKNRIDDIHIMLQKEFANRLVAGPEDGKDYSSISLFVHYHFSVEKLFTVKKTCFWPVPEVDSVFLKLRRTTLYSLEAKNEKLLFRIIRAAFSKRRKTILNSLASVDFDSLGKEKIEAVLKKAGISIEKRAEDLRLEDFVKLANIMN